MPMPWTELETSLITVQEHFAELQINKPDVLSTVLFAGELQIEPAQKVLSFQKLKTECGMHA
jgi:hypothetical protein